MSYEELTTEELKIKEQIASCEMLEGLSLPEDTLYWATRLVSLVNDGASWGGLLREDLYETLELCLFCEARARALPAPDPHWTPETIQALEHDYAFFMGEAVTQARRAVDVAARGMGVHMSSRAFVELDHHNAPSGILQAACHALVLAVPLSCSWSWPW